MNISYENTSATWSPVLKPFLYLLVFACILTFANSGCRIEKRISEVSLERQASASFQWKTGGTVAKRIEWSRIQTYSEAAATITPRERSSLAGYGGLDRRLFPPRLYRGSDPSVYCRPFEEIETEPRIKISLLTGRSESEPDIEKAYLIVNLDLVAVTQDVTQWLLDTANETLQGLAEFEHANFQVIATHTHSGPSGLSLSPLWSAFACDTFRKNYRDHVTETFKTLLSETWVARQQVSRIQITETHVEGFNASRYDGMPVDSQIFVIQPLGKLSDPFIVSDPNSSRDDAAPPEQQIDLAEKIGCSFSYPVHSTYYGPSSLKLSTDLAGQLEKAFARVTGSPDCFFMNGVSGNSRAKISAEDPEQYANAVANSYQEKILSSQNTSQPHAQEDNLQFSYGAIPFSLPRPSLNFSGCGATGAENVIGLPILDDLPKESKISYMQFGNFAFVYFPGELLFATANILRSEIAKKIPADSKIFFITTANDYTGYVLPSNDYASKSLESCSSLFGKDYLKRILENIIPIF